MDIVIPLKMLTSLPNRKSARFSLSGELNQKRQDPGIVPLIDTLVLWY